jgi:hypothetical protein
MPSYKWVPVNCKFCGTHQRNDDSKCSIKQVSTTSKLCGNVHVTIFFSNYAITQTMIYSCSSYPVSKSKKCECFKCGLELTNESSLYCNKWYECKICKISIVFNSADKDFDKIEDYVLLHNLYQLGKI